MRHLKRFVLAQAVRRERKIVQPALRRLERVVGGPSRRQRVKICTRPSSKDWTWRHLDALLTSEVGWRSTRENWLRQSVGSAPTKNVAKLLERVNLIRALKLDFSGVKTIHQNRLKGLVREGKLLAIVLERLETLTDAAMEIHDTLGIRLLRREAKPSVTSCFLSFSPARRLTANRLASRYPKPRSPTRSARANPYASSTQFA